MVLPGRSSTPWIELPFGTTSVCQSFSAVAAASSLDVTIRIGRLLTTAEIEAITPTNANWSWFDSSAGISAAPPSPTCGLIFRPSSAKKPSSSPRYMGAALAIGGVPTVIVFGPESPPPPPPPELPPPPQPATASMRPATSAAISPPRPSLSRTASSPASESRAGRPPAPRRRRRRRSCSDSRLALARRLRRLQRHRDRQVERGAQDAVLLGRVGGGIALARRRALGAADEAEVEVLRHDLHEAGEHVGAGAHVARLLLDPDDLAEVRVAADELRDLRLGERVEELDAPDGDALVGLAVRVADEVVVDLAGAEDEARDLLDGHPRLAEHGEEPRLGEVLDPVRRLGQAQQRLRGHDHERALLGDLRLAADQVEVLRRRREVRDADVALGGEREEALEARRGMLGARPLVAVREQQRQARRLPPLREARDDELVDDDLRRVDEVAELRLPEHERLGGLGRVAVLEAEARDLAERRVVQLEGRLRAGEALDRRQRLAGLGVVQDHVALRERPALGVLTGEPDRDALGEQRGEREHLGVGPVDPALLAERYAPAIELLDELRVDGEAVRHGEHLVVELAQRVGRDGRRDLRRRRAVELVLAGRVLDRAGVLGGLDLRLEALVQLGEVVPDLLALVLDLLLRHDAGVDELLGPQLGDALLVLDLRVHLGLRVRGLVALVVAEAAIADEVDDDVVAELLAEREREAHRRDARGDVVGVDVDDRRVVALGEVGRPPGRARVLGVGREADLVVLDEVQRAADLVAVDRLQVQRLGDDALAGERGVAVQHDRHGGVRVAAGVRAGAAGLGGAARAEDDRVDVLEVRRVRLEVDEDRVAVRQLVGALRAVVVLDVAGAALRQRRHGLERRGALELGEDRLVRAAEVVGEDVEAAAVRHAADHLARAVRGGELDHLVEHRHGRLEALDRELLLAEVRLVHEALEGVDLDEALQERLLLVGAQRLAKRAGLDLLAQPHALAVAGDVLDLVGDRPAIRLAQLRQRVGQRRAAHVHAQDPRGDAGHDLGRQADRVRVERRVALWLGAERVEAGGEVAVG